MGGGLRTRRKPSPVQPRLLTSLGMAFLLLATAVPMPAAGELTDELGPCAAASLLPPTIRADPNCIILDEGDALIKVKPVADGVDVEVSWTYKGDMAEVDGFIIYRGTTPSALHPVHEVGNHTMEWEDEQALIEGPALWYAVGVKKADDLLKSQAYMVQIGIEQGGVPP